MNIEKQTYYNTEHLQELYERKSTAIAFYGESDGCGTLAFSLKRKSTVKIELRLRSLEGVGVLTLDGKIAGRVTTPYLQLNVKPEQGEHLVCFTVESGTHGAYEIEAEGVGLDEAHSYPERVGGYRTESECVLYMKTPGRKVVKYSYAEGSLVRSVENRSYSDEAYLYDAANGAYTATRRSVYSEDSRNFTLQTGVSSTHQRSAIKGLAMCDGRTLESGANYLVAVLDGEGNLRFIRAMDGTAYQASDLSDTVFTGIRRVMSAQRGSIFLVENRDHVWSGYFFHAGGTKTLVFSGLTLHYDEIPLCRNRSYSPTADADAEGNPVFYFKKEEGALMRMAYGGTGAAVAYADAFHPCASGGLLQFAGELSYTQL